MAADHSHALEHDDGAVHVHIASSRFYFGIFAALVCLTIATVKVSYYDFGSANIVIAIAIATAKGSLVAAFFMHLRHDKLFNTLAFLAAFLFLAIFILLTYDDLGHRGQIDPSYGGTVSPQS
ncbi:MAG: cytochrome C oxidase subunit IV family protein, partial [Polyangiaceae bacterium]